MNKRTLALAFFLLAALCLSAETFSAVSLTTPSDLENFKSEVGFAHRFYGVVNHEPLDTFFGTSWGANVQAGFRQHLVKGTELKLAYISALKQYQVGAAWQFTPRDFPLNAQIDVTYASFKPLGIFDRETDIGVLLSAQSDAFFDRLAVTLNAGYNTYYERIAAGVGVHLLLTEDLSLIGEYYPLLEDANNSDNLYQVGDHSAFSAGLKMDTWGHSFVLSVSNAAAFDPTQNSLGADSKGKLQLGFNIKRRLSLF